MLSYRFLHNGVSLCGNDVAISEDFVYLHCDKILRLLNCKYLVYTKWFGSVQNNQTIAAIG